MTEFPISASRQQVRSYAICHVYASRDVASNGNQSNSTAPKNEQNYVVSTVLTYRCLMNLQIHLEQNLLYGVMGYHSQQIYQLQSFLQQNAASQVKCHFQTRAD